MSKNDIEPAGAQPIWPLAPQGSGALALPQAWGQQPAGGSMLPGDLNLATLWRIASEGRWLILGAVAVGVAGAVVITFLTTPLYRAEVMLEINPPTVEAVDQSKVSRETANERDYLATVVGLLQSRSLAERVAQDLNLASNPAIAPQQADRDTRIKVAAGRVRSAFTAKPIEGSRLVKMTYVSSSPTLAAQVANSYADNFIESALQRRYDASSYAR